MNSHSHTDNNDTLLYLLVNFFVKVDVVTYEALVKEVKHMYWQTNLTPLVGHRLPLHAAGKCDSVTSGELSVTIYKFKFSPYYHENMIQKLRITVTCE